MQCTSLYVLVILFLVLKVFGLCVSLFGKIAQPFEGRVFCAAFKISQVCWVLPFEIYSVVCVCFDCYFISLSQ